MNENIPLACDMNVFTPVQRDHHIQNTVHLIQELQSVQDLDHGYEFFFPKESETISRIAEFIANERLCCPFLEFNLNIGPSREFISLSLSGPAGTREFLRVEFDGAFQ